MIKQSILGNEYLETDKFYIEKTKGVLNVKN